VNVNKAVVTEVVIFGLGLSIGGGVAYALTKRKYVKLIDEEIESVKQTYDRRYKSGEFATPAAALATVRNLEEQREDIDEQLDDFSKEIRDLGYDGAPTEAPDPEIPVITNLGEVEVTVEDLPMPDNMEPHVISYEDFMDADWNHFDKISITYFQQDDTLMDDNEEVIPDIENLLGPDATSSFGGISQDPDQVFIRAGKMRTDFEVTRDVRSYQEVVLQIDPETGLRIGSRADD